MVSGTQNTGTEESKRVFEVISQKSKAEMFRLSKEMEISKPKLDERVYEGLEAKKSRKDKAIPKELSGKEQRKNCYMGICQTSFKGGNYCRKKMLRNMWFCRRLTVTSRGI